MIPVRAHRTGGGPPLLTWTLAALCTAVSVRLALLDPGRAAQLMRALAVVPARLTDQPVAQGLTLLTSLFLHAGWVHLVGNMLFLLVFGPGVERRLGAWRFLALYITSGVIGCLAFVWLNPDSLQPLVGASGAIAGILGAHLVVEPRARITTVVPALVIFEVATLPAAFVIAAWFALQVTATLAPISGAARVDVAWIAHLAGFAVGVAFALPFAARDAWKRRTRRAPSRETRRDALSRRKRAA